MSRGRAEPRSHQGDCASWRSTAGRPTGRPRLSRLMSKCRPANIINTILYCKIEVFAPSELRSASSEVCRWTWTCPRRWARSRRRRSTWRRPGTAPSAGTPPSGNKKFNILIFFYKYRPSAKCMLDIAFHMHLMSKTLKLYHSRFTAFHCLLFFIKGE